MYDEPWLWFDGGNDESDEQELAERLIHVGLEVAEAGRLARGDS